MRVVTSAVPLATVLRSPGDSSAAATLQLVALLRHPDGVDELAGGEIEQISIGAVAECGVGRPVHVRRMRVAGRDSGEHLALRGVDKERGIRLMHRDVEVAVDIDRHAVAAVVGEPIDQHTAIADRAVGRERVGKQRS